MNYNKPKRSVKIMYEKLNTAKNDIKRVVKKFNIIDILLIILIFLSLVSLLYKLTMGNDAKYQSYEFVYVCDNAPIELIGTISVDSKCADADTGDNLGKVTEVITDNGDNTSARSNVRIKVKTNGFESEHGVTIGNTVYLKGKRLNLIVGDTVFDAYISEINSL